MLKKEDVLNDPVAPRFELILDRDGVKTNRAVLTHPWLATIVIRGRVYSLIVSAGFEFDGRSVTDYNRYDADYIRAALAHDYLYAAHPIIYLDGEEYVVTRRDADKVYDDLLKRHGKVNIIKRKRDYIFLRIFGGAAWRGHNIEDNERARALGLIMDTGVNVCDLD